jgi:methionine-rich copper-binding protein CopC
MKHWFAWAALGIAGAALAHARLQTSTPADGSVLQQSPATFSLKFDEPATITLLTLQKEGEALQKLQPPSSKPGTELSVPAPKLTAGSYSLNYKAVSADNHVVSGAIHFRLAP